MGQVLCFSRIGGSAFGSILSEVIYKFSSKYTYTNESMRDNF